MEFFNSLKFRRSWKRNTKRTKKENSIGETASKLVNVGVHKQE